MKPVKIAGSGSFVELFSRSNFSFLKGASHPEEMVIQAHGFGQQTLGLCDLNGLYGVGRAFQQAELLHFPLTVGTELTLCDSSSVGLLPLNKQGYAKLCRLITLGKRNAPKGQSLLRLEDVLSHSEHLLCFATPPFFDEAHLQLLQTAFGDRLYLALHRHRNWLSERQAQMGLVLAEKLGIEAFATNRPCMHRPEQKKVLDILTCIDKGLTLEESGRELSLNGEAYLKSQDQMLKIWADHPELVFRSGEIISRINFSLHELRYQYPREALPEGEEDSQIFLEKLVWQKAKIRYGSYIPEKARALLMKELKLINTLKYEDYFLTMWDIIEFAQSQKILFQGRGSAANSAVCYVLGITAIDPMKFEILFERFLSFERGEPPDIDVDFEHERREEVIQYIYTKYGHEHAAMVCEVICFRSRMAIREVAKVFGVPLLTINKMIKFMGREGMTQLFTPEGAKAIKKWNISTSLFHKIINCALLIKGYPRHLGIHTGGFVIAQDPIIETVPVEKATMDGRYVVQWNKDDLEAMGLMKIDVLSLGMLTCLQKCLKLLKARGIEEHLHTIPLEDEKVFEMVARADTIGVFQIESRAQMSMLPRLRPRCFYDYVVQVAIVRPGPLQGGMIHPYLRRRQKLELPTYEHPALKPVLEKTLGVPIFQEQVMRMAVVVAKFTPGESNELRRVMSSAWRKGERMEVLKKRLFNGMREFGIADHYAQRIYKTIEGFGSYGFPESHAASFALLTAASAYIKCHYPDIFTCALLNSQPMGFYSAGMIISDAQRHGVIILSPDINFSSYDYGLEKENHLRVGFRALYGLSKLEIGLILEKRTGPYLNLEDLVRRCSLSQNTLLRLASSGCFGSFGYSVREALWNVLRLPFDRSEDHDLDLLLSDEKKEFASLTPWEQVENDYKVLGFSVDWHPMAALRKNMIERDCLTSKELPLRKDQSFIRVAGMVSVRQKPPTAKGTMFLTLEDEFGVMNIIVQKKVYESYRAILGSEPLLVIEGTLQSRSGAFQIQAQKVSPLPVNNPTYLNHSRDWGG